MQELINFMKHFTDTFNGIFVFDIVKTTISKNLYSKHGTFLVQKGTDILPQKFKGLLIPLYYFKSKCPILSAITKWW